MLDQSCVNVDAQHWHNFDPTLKCWLGINISIVEFIRTTENCLLNIFSVRISFLPTVPSYQDWSDVENETKFGVGFSTLHNVDTKLEPDIETTSKQCCATFL